MPSVSAVRWIKECRRLGRYTLIRPPGDTAVVYRLNRLTGGVVVCVAGGNKDGTTSCE